MIFPPRILPRKKQETSLLPYLESAFFIGIALYLGKILFIPLFYGLLIAIVLFPLCKYLERKGWPRSLAVAACLLVVTVLIAALLLLLYLEIKAFAGDLPELQPKIAAAIAGLQQWLSDNLNLTAGNQVKWLTSQGGLADKLGTVLQGTVKSTVNILFMAFMVPVYTALFLYGRRTFIRFLRSLAGSSYRDVLDKILHKTVHTYHQYIKGMIMVYLIVGILNSVGLLLLGVEHPFLFGMLTAIMTIIPYAGIIISSMLPISLSWITTGSIWLPLAIVAVFVFVQYLEANVIFPKVVGTQLGVNTWATLVAAIAGGLFWGVSGMILFIPFVGILKIVADDLPALKPLQILLGRSDT